MISSTLQVGAGNPVGWHPSQQSPRDGTCLVIGIVNNMPDAALISTERQFRELLSDASHDLTVHLRYLSLREIPRGDAGRLYVREHHEDIDALWTSHLDGLIVTGTEPRAQALADEPYWPALTRLIDWAEGHTTSTIWSCLAAHATVLHIDGIERRAFGRKLSGLFECTKSAEHAVLASTPAKWCVPHSRHNDIPEELLVPKGYQVLSRSLEGGVDMFVRQERSLFLFMQGHLEYDPGALLREYRRDVGRFLAGESDRYPEIPCNYFDDGTAAALEEFRQQAMRARSVDLFSSFPVSAAAQRPKHAWRDTATQIFANWFSHLIERRSRNIGHLRSASQ